MKLKLITLLLVLISLASCVHPNKSPETRFWEWFQDHQLILFNFESDQDNVFNQLTKEMEKVNADLTFEFGPVTKDGKREFIISAGGIKSAFPAVEALYKSAPKLEKWTFIRFRPRREPPDKIEFGGKALSAKDVRFVLLNDDDKNKVDILLLLDGYKESQNETYGQIGFLFLDNALGEYDVETHVGNIEFLSMDTEYYNKSLPISELAKRFDAFFSDGK